MFPRNPAYAVRLLSIPVMVCILAILWCTAASAADRTYSVTRNADGSTERCAYDRDFVTTQDGSHVIRKAWRCVKTPAAKN